MEYRGLKCWVCGVHRFAKPGYLEDWSDLYEINQEGVVRDKATGEIVKEHNYDGRKQLWLMRGDKKVDRYVHRCVATTFPEICGEYGERYQVDHINSNPLDNRAVNLRWVKDFKENMANPATQEKIRKGREGSKEYYRSLWKGWKPSTLEDFYKYKYS